MQVTAWPVAEVFWLRSGFAASAAALTWTVLTHRHERERRIGLLCLAAVSVLSYAAAIATRWMATGQGPFLTLYEVLLSNLFSLSLVFTVLAVSSAQARRIALPVLGVVSMLGVWTISLPAHVVPLPPTFEHPWLWVHVFSGKVFLALSLVGASGSALCMARTGVDVPLESFVWRTAAVAFAFDSAMLLAGAVWANDAWGRFWAWDPLETWAFATWVALAALLHARLGYALPARVAHAWNCGVFALAVLTFFGVPFMSAAPHKGVF